MLSKLIPEVIISDKIQIKKEYVSEKEITGEFVYHLDDSFVTTLQEDEDNWYLGIGCLPRLNVTNIVDKRVSLKLSQKVQFKATLKPAQERTLQQFVKEENYDSGILKAKCGWGKCSVSTSKILTNHGYLEFKELLNNSYDSLKIINHKGQFLVKHVYSTGKKQCFAVKTQLNTVNKVTEDHPLLTWDGESLQFKITKNLKIGDLLVGKRNTNLFGNIKIEEDAYLLGLLIGDGGLTLLNKFYFTSNDKELKDYYKQWATVNNQSVIHYDNGNNTETIYFSNSSLYAKYVTQYDLQCKSIHKEICQKLRSLNKEQTKELLQGLFDTDGCVNKDGTIEYCSSSKELLYWVFETLLNFGIISRVKQKHTACSDTFMLDINSKYECEKFRDIIGFKLSRKQKLLDIWKAKSNGSTTTGNFVGLNRLVYNFYRSCDKLYGKGYSSFFNNYRKNEISLKKYSEFLHLLRDKNIDIPINFLELEDCFASPITEILDIGWQETADLEVDDDSHCYISNGIINHNSFWGVKLITDAGDHTMILMHTKLLQDQWRELFLKFTDYEPGMIGDGVFNPKPITLGLYISVNNRIEELKNNYGRVVVDEVHRCGADLFADTLTRFPARYKNGMSATPSRRDGKHVLFPDYFSSLFVEAEEYRDLIKPDIDIRQVPFKFEVLNPTRDWAKALSKIYSNIDYLDMIVANVNNLILDGRTCLLIGARTEALEYLQEKILFSAVLIGKTKNRDEIVSGIGTKYKCVLSTTIFDEGLSAHMLDTLVLTGPTGKNFQLLEQRIGRIQREHPDKQPALVQAYWLQNHILAKQQAIEYRWYLSKSYKILT
jgi:superfamily II DNA or RNA helicase/intein/homing endonuclease